MRPLSILSLLLCALPDADAQQGLDSLERLVHRTAAERMVLLNDYYVSGMDAQDSATIFQRIAKVRELATNADAPPI